MQKDLVHRRRVILETHHTAQDEPCCHALLMPLPIFSSNLQRLTREYGLNDPLEATRFQNNVMQYMDIVRATISGISQEDDDANRQLADQFCSVIDDKKVWNLAEMVIPEFQLALAEQYLSWVYS